MSILVHGAPLSPYVRKVRVTLAEKSIPYELKIAVPYDLPEGYEALNPLRRIPAFQDDDVTLADSAVICHYIEQRHPDTTLMPQAADSRAHCEWLEKYADYELAPVTTMTLFRETLIKPLTGKQGDQERIADALDSKLPPLLDYLTEQLGDNTWFIEERFSLADIAIACQLINMEHADFMLDASRWPTLHRFLQRCYERPSFKDTVEQERAQIAKVRAHLNR